jgi:hypothetical protein
VLEAANYLVFHGGHSLRDLLDYEDGVDPESFFSLYNDTLKKVAERKRDRVENFSLALASLFDGKVMKKFNESIDKIVGKLSDLQEAPYKPKKPPLSQMSRQEKRAAMASTMQQMKKLDRLFSGDFEGWVPGEND